MSQMNPGGDPTRSAAHSEFEDGQPHRPADDREVVYFEGSPLLRGEMGKLIFSAILAAILIAAPIVIHRSRPDLLAWWGWAIFIGLAILCLLIPSLLLRSIRYRISNYRIDFERGIFSKNIDTLELWHVEDIQFHQSLGDRMFNVGDITVISHDDTTPKLVLAGVPNPRPLFESLKQRVIAVKRQRGVVKMDIPGTGAGGV